MKKLLKEKSRLCCDKNEDNETEDKEEGRQLRSIGFYKSRTDRSMCIIHICKGVPKVGK